MVRQGMAGTIDVAAYQRDSVGILSSRLVFGDEPFNGWRREGSCYGEGVGAKNGPDPSVGLTRLGCRRAGLVLCHSQKQG